MAEPKGDEDVLSLLDSLAGSAPEKSPTPVYNPASTESEKELLGFLDNLAKQPSTPRPASRAAVTHSTRDPASNSPTLAKNQTESSMGKPISVPTAEAPAESGGGGGGGGWLGGLWTMGSAAIKTAELKVKELQ